MFIEFVLFCVFLACTFVMIVKFGDYKAALASKNTFHLGTLIVVTPEGETSIEYRDPVQFVESLQLAKSAEAGDFSLTLGSHKFAAGTLSRIRVKINTHTEDQNSHVNLDESWAESIGVCACNHRKGLDLVQRFQTGFAALTNILN